MEEANNYQTDFVCTYHLMDDDNDKDQLYRIQLLQAFNNRIWDDVIINNMISLLFNKISNSNSIQEILIKAKQNSDINQLIDLVLLGTDIITNSNDIDILTFTLLFKFDHFYLLHRCICDQLINNDIDSVHLNNLLNTL